ncbi:MAG: CTP synthase [Candidatus Micrarchaeaceae archaeon]
MHTKFVVVLGSLMSGLGKGVVTSSILKMLSFYGYNALPIKFDGYLNYDCGTMNPYRHGEVFVLDDGGEVDMDFGTYERFLNKSMTTDQSITGGKLFSAIIQKERRGDFLGRDVQVIPHLTDYIIKSLEDLVRKKKVDVLVIEVGGTVGDIENGYFIEAMRQLALNHRVVFVNLTYTPKLSVVGEQKTKPTQLAFRSLMQAGIVPNFIVCRSEDKLDPSTAKKLALFTNLDTNRIIDDANEATIYETPINFMKQKFDKLLIRDLKLEPRKLDTKKLNKWKNIVNMIKNPKDSVTVAIVGKYTNLRDSYASVKEAIIHAGAWNHVSVNIKWIESATLETSRNMDALSDVDGIIVPGGFGRRGIEGKILAIKYAREQKVPYLGLCLGMQLMAIEYARNVCGLKGANSTEFSPRTKYNVIDLLPSQRGVKEKGGTMRLGAWKCRILSKDSIAYRSYKKEIISERHRHRYELNNKYKRLLERNGLRITGTTLDGKLVEIIEWPNQFGIGTQAHPELKSRPESPAPLFVSFIDASKRYKSAKKRLNQGKPLLKASL